jgi:predicted N-acetyltransferase YhbS
MAKIKIERKTDWSMRTANADDKEGIERFYKQNIWKNKDAQILYKWKYEENPFGQTLMQVGVNSANNIISNCAFMPWRFRLGEKIVKATQIADGVIQLEYRGQGISLKQLNKGIEETEVKGAQFSFAFPNEAGATVHRKNNGYHLGHIIRFTKPLQTRYLINRFIKSRLLLCLMSLIGDSILRLCSKETYYSGLGKFIIEEAKGCGGDFDEFWNRFTRRFNKKIITNKDSNYLRWKYLNCPNKNRRLYFIRAKERIQGFIVLESTAQIGYIVDILAYDKDAFNCLIVYAIKYFRKQSKDSVVYVALENNMYFKEFRNFGFVERPEKKYFYIYFNGDIKKHKFFMDSRNWFVTIGDCDVEVLV